MSGAWPVTYGGPGYAAPSGAAAALEGSTFIVTLAGKMVVDPVTGKVTLDVNHADGFTMNGVGVAPSPALANAFSGTFPPSQPPPFSYGAPQAAQPAVAVVPVQQYPAYTPAPAPPPVQQPPPPPPQPVAPPPPPVPAPAPAPAPAPEPQPVPVQTYVPLQISPPPAPNPEEFVPYGSADVGSGGVVTGGRGGPGALPPPPPPPSADVRVPVNAALPPPPPVVAESAIASGGFVTGGAAYPGAQVANALAHEVNAAPAPQPYQYTPPLAPVVPAATMVVPSLPPSPPPPVVPAAPAPLPPVQPPPVAARAVAVEQAPPLPPPPPPPPPPPKPAVQPTDAEVQAATVHVSDTCSGTVELNGEFGVITDGPGPYSNGLRCAWILDPPGDNPVRLTVVPPFDIEGGYDFLKVYDGRGEDFLIDQVSETSPGEPVTIVSETGTILVVFESDYMGTRPGFVAAYEDTWAAGERPAESTGNLARAIATAKQHAAAAGGAGVPAAPRAEADEEGPLGDLGALAAGLPCEDGLSACALDDGSWVALDDWQDC